MEKPTFSVTVNGNEKRRIELDAPGAYSGTIDGQPFTCDTAQDKPGSFHVLRDHVSYNVELIKADYDAKLLVLRINGNTYEVALRDKYDDLLHALGMDNMSGRKVNELKAPMPGLVLDVLVQEGVEVKKGDALIVLEAMKMENILKSPTDGVIKRVSAKKGTAVEKNQLLLEFA